MALVGQVGLAGVVGAQLRVGQERGQPPARVAPAEAHHLYGEAGVLAKALHPLGRLRHHHEPARGGDHDLLAQEGAAAALDQAAAAGPPRRRRPARGRAAPPRPAPPPRCLPRPQARACARRPPRRGCRPALPAGRAGPHRAARPQAERHARLDQLCCRCGGRAPGSRLAFAAHAGSIAGGGVAGQVASSRTVSPPLDSYET